jgi:phage terminase large subunit-like protein
MGLSAADRIARLPEPDRRRWWASLTDTIRAEVVKLPWWFVRRPEQAPPDGDWSIWLIQSGRGWGKTRTGAETLLDWVDATPVAPDGAPTEWLIIAETFSDCRKICVQGPSGILRALRCRGYTQIPTGREFTAGADREFRYSKSEWQVVFVTGQVIHMAGADDADAGRGLNLAGVWADELAKWPYPSETWTEGLAPALRIGQHPRAIVTTTPKPIELLRDWTKRTDGSVAVTKGSTFDNAVNLSLIALAELRKRYAGTRMGRQELYGDLLDDVEGALWQRRLIDQHRVAEAPPLHRVVVAVDPAVTSGEKADYTGIVVMGRGPDLHGYVLADRTMRATPLAWAQAIVSTYREFRATVVVIETNQGGEALAALIHTVDSSVPVVDIHAKRGKRVRAEPVSSLYEQGRIHHVGSFPDLEDQLCSWTPEQVESPDRMDALVYAALHLFESSSAGDYLHHLAPPCPKCGTPVPPGEAHVCSPFGAGIGSLDSLLSLSGMST